jgi:hypothetical protein
MSIVLAALDTTPKLAHHDDVERLGERVGHLEGDGYPAPRQSEHHNVLILELAPLKLFGQPPTSIDPVTKHHGHLPVDWCQPLPRALVGLGPMVPDDAEKWHFRHITLLMVRLASH